MGDCAEFVVSVWHARYIPVGEVGKGGVRVRMVGVSRWDRREDARGQQAKVEADAECWGYVVGAALSEFGFDCEAVAAYALSMARRRNSSGRCARDEPRF